MEANKVNILLSDEAKEFVRSLHEKARKKVAFNIRKVEVGIMDKDLFRKTQRWRLGASHIVWRNVLPSTGILGQGTQFFDYRNSRLCQEDVESASKRIR